MPEESTAPEQGQEQPQTTPGAPEQEATETSAQPEPFSDKFDPASLPDELRPAYKQLQADYTRKTQTLAEQRREAETYKQWVEALRNPETQAEALEALGLELAEQEPEEDDEEFVDPLEQRLAALEGYLAEQGQVQMTQAQQEAELDYLESEFEGLEKDIGRQLEEDEIQVIGQLANSRRSQEGLPDVRGSYEFLYNDFLPKRKQGWVSTKKAPQVVSGQSATKVPDLDDRRSRQDYMAQKLAEADEFQ
jgi:hypothetical protein